MESLNKTLDLYLVKKAPPMPATWQTALVKFLPWITLIVLILALPALLAIFGIGAFLMPFAYMSGVNYGTMYMISLAILAITVVLEGMAISGLFKQKLSAWKLLYYATLLNGLSSLIYFNLFGLLIGTLLSLYILFQIKHHYH